VMASVDPTPADPKLQALQLKELYAAHRKLLFLRDAWQRLALARGILLADVLGPRLLDGGERLTHERRIAKAVRDLERLGLNPQTGRPLPKPAKKKR
jgi:hypothetical protein